MIKPKILKMSLAIVLASSILTPFPIKAMSTNDLNEEVITVDENFNLLSTKDLSSNFTVLESGGSVQVVDIPDSSNKSVYLEDTSDESHVTLSKTFEPLAGQMTFQMKFMQSQYTSSTKVARVKGGGSTSFILETEDENLAYRHGDDTFEKLVSVEENTWYDIKVIANVERDTVDVYIDGDLKIEGAPFYQPSDQIDYFETFSPNSKMIGHYVDDIRIAGLPFIEEEVEEPEAPKSPSQEEQSSESDSGIYEAEDADGSGTIIDNKHIGYTGDGFVDFNPNQPGGYLEWTIEVPEDGQYTLAFHYSHGKSDNRPIEVKVNDKVVNSKLGFPSTGDYMAYQYVSTEAQLKAGENVIRITGTGPEGGANIDHMKVFKNVDILSEAEDADISAAIVDNKHPGHTGTGFVDYKPNAPGGYIEWTVDIPQDGEYTLEFTYANGGGANRPAEIKVNEEVIAPELPFEPTGDWAKWLTSSTKVNLTAGENVIRATGVGAEGGANIDHLRIHNKLGEDQENEVVSIEPVEMSEIVNEFLKEELEARGILVSSSSDRNQKPVTRLEFIALVNNVFGLEKDDTFKNLGIESDIWELSEDDWGTYVAEVAKDNDYINGYPNGKLMPDKVITKRQVAYIIANLLDVDPDSDTVEELTGFGPKGVFTWAEAQKLVENLATKQAEQIHIARADALTDHIIAVTLNGTFEEVDYNDLAISVPTGSWDSLTPRLTKNLRIHKAAKGMDKFGNTVLILESKDSLAENAEFIDDSNTITEFKGDLEAAKEQAENLLTWQMDHGGWSKNKSYMFTRKWNGVESRSEWVKDGVELGTIDNDATIKEIRFLAQVYRETGDKEIKKSILKGIDFLFNLQYPTGGFAQVYPERGNYSDYVTYNDGAMIRVLELFDDVQNKKYPFDQGDLIDSDLYSKIETSMNNGIDYILKSQIEVNGELTAWCAQHDPVTYEPQHARSYEHPSISGSESIGIVKFLMARPNQTKEIKQAIEGALRWLDEVKLENTRYVSADPNGEYFVEDTGEVAWYRFYEIGTNKPIFSGRDGVIKRTIQEIEKERRDGYSWGGNWAEQLLNTAKNTGYFENKVYARVVNTNSKDIHGRTLVKDEVSMVHDLSQQLDEIPNKITVSKDGNSDYTEIQDAIDAVPENNTEEVKITIDSGVYQEVINIPPTKPNISLIGSGKKKTIITYDNYAGKERPIGGTFGTSGSATAFLYADNFRAENLTFENSFDYERDDVKNKQAVAVHARGDRMIFKNVNIIGRQDTLLAHSGSQYFYKSYIEGNVDFIFGGARAVFEECEIYSVDRGSSSNNGYITAASTMNTQPYGFLFIDSRITSDAAEGTVHLGRPWHPSGNPDAIGSVVFKNSYLGKHINPEGWTDMSGFSAEDARFYEFKNYGPGAVTHDSRTQLTEDQAKEYTVENVLDGWNPQP